MTHELIQLRVPGAVYELAFSPLCTEFERETGIKPARWLRTGRGWSCMYEVTPEDARYMMGIAEDLAGTWCHGAGPEGARDARILRVWLDRARGVVDAKGGAS